MSNLQVLDSAAFTLQHNNNNNNNNNLVPQFDGSTWLAYEPPSTLNKRVQLRMQVKATQPNGLLLYFADASNTSYVLMYLLRSTVVVQVQIGAAPVMLRCAHSY